MRRPPLPPCARPPQPQSPSRPGWDARGVRTASAADGAREPRARAQILERETTREKNLEKAQKEAKARARREAARAAEAAPAEAGAAADAELLLRARARRPLQSRDKHAARAPWLRLPLPCASVRSLLRHSQVWMEWGGCRDGTPDATHTGGCA